MKTLLVISAMLVSLTAFCDTKPTIVLQNKKHPKREVTFQLPGLTMIRTINGKTYSAQIIGAHDSVIVIKERNMFPQGFSKAENQAFRNIRKDKTMTDDQKQIAYNKIWYPDSMQLPLSSIKSLSYSVKNTKHGKLKANIALGVQLLSCVTQISLLDLNDPGNGNTDVDYPLHIQSGVSSALLLTLAWVPLAEYYYMFRTMHPADWHIVKQ